MYFHLEKKVFNKFIGDMSQKISIDADIIEKDYYVCMVLQELAKNQDYLKAYFKGGTEVYKILDTMNRFSEDIDLTVEVVKDTSNNSNKTRLKKSALGYKIPGLELEKEKTKDVKQSVTAYYKYQTAFEIGENQLHKAGEIQVEATSFTVSEPVENYMIEPLLYRYANNDEREILETEFEIKPFEIKVQKLERIFIDKLFAAQMYFERDMYIDLSKHLYDLCVIFKAPRIRAFLDNKNEVEKIIKYKREEEMYRKGGVDKKLQVKEFGYFNINFNKDMLNAFDFMQTKYIFDNKYRIDIEELRITLKGIKQFFES